MGAMAMDIDTMNPEHWKQRALRAEAELRSMPVPTLRPATDIELARLRDAAQEAISHFKKLGSATHPDELMRACSRCEVFAARLSEAMGA
jgi:hypothetical protein